MGECCNSVQAQAPGAKRVAPLEVAPDTVKGRVTLAHLGGAAHVRQVMETANPNRVNENREIRNEVTAFPFLSSL